MTALLDVRELAVHYPVRARGLTRRRTGAVRAVDGVSFTVERGRTLGLVGESGGGKSTTGRAILMLQRPTAGSVLFEGVDLAGVAEGELRNLRRRMQLVFQDPYASLDPRMTVGRLVGEALDIHGLAVGRSRAGRVADLLELVGLDPKHAGRYPHEFSGGQRQRIGIARALAVEPIFLVCDEPVSALDVSIQAQVMNLLADLRDRLGLSYVFISHDLAVVRHISDRVAVMYLGKIVEMADRDDLYDQPLHPYTKALLSSVPSPDPNVQRARERVMLRGELPSPADPPPGCRFHTRCPHAQELCRVVEPPLVSASAGHVVACHFWRELRSTPVEVTRARTSRRTS
ncbi:MAG: dipeptide ABC transporter ATP-binding protein [Actinobacteria bacterium]|nr:dipeptide ABC transporter ATP-binding protein [Actinomycetota bacterium]